MSSPILENRLFFRDDNSRPLGRLTFAGTHLKGAGLGESTMRVFGQYAIVLTVDGLGYYRDSLGTRTTLKAGDLTFVFPEIPHTYGPKRGSHWDEIYVAFDGGVFDLWRQQGLLNPHQPVVAIPDWRGLFAELKVFLEEQRPTTQTEYLHYLHRFMMLLLKVLPVTTPQNEPEWLLRAKSLLQSNLERDLTGEELARSVGLSYQTFRKSFARECGVSPSRYRVGQRIEAAKTLLENGSMTHGAIARSLGFRDEAHFARRFKQLTAQTPRDYRRAQKHENSASNS